MGRSARSRGYERRLALPSRNRPHRSNRRPRRGRRGPNALVYPAIAGYDAQEALDYAELLARDGELPEGTGSYYTPPGFFAVGGVGILLGEKLGMEHPERVGQLVNAGAAVGTVLLLLLLVRTLWPGRRVLHLAALGFVVACPVVFKASAMFHPEPLSLFFDARDRARRADARARQYSLGVALGIGAALAAGQLVRAWTLWTVGVVLLVLVVALVASSGAPRDRSCSRSRRSRCRPPRAPVARTRRRSIRTRSSTGPRSRLRSGTAGRSASTSASACRTC